MPIRQSFISPSFGGEFDDDCSVKQLQGAIPGDVILFYPSKLRYGQIFIHFYQNYHDFEYFHSLCTHIGIYLGDQKIVDATPEYGIRIRQFEDFSDRIVRIRRLTRLSDVQLRIFVDAAKSLHGKKYDFLGIVGGITGLKAAVASMRERIDKIHVAGQHPADDAASEARSANALYFSQVFEYCYTKAVGLGLSDVPIQPLFLPAAISATEDLEDISR